MTTITGVFWEQNQNQLTNYFGSKQSFLNWVAIQWRPKMNELIVTGKQNALEEIIKERKRQLGVINE